MYGYHSPPIHGRRTGGLRVGGGGTIILLLLFTVTHSYHRRAKKKKKDREEGKAWEGSFQHQPPTRIIHS